MRIVTLGEFLIDMFPGELGKGLTEVASFLPKPGGAPANVAVAARRLGAQSGFIGKVGDDAFGHFLIDVLRAEGVETRGMRTDAEARTTMAFIAMPDPNHAEFVFYRNPGADTRLQPDELDRELLESTHAFHFGSLSLTDEPVRSATLEAIRIVKSAGGMISYDVNYRPALWYSPDAALKAAQEMLRQADLLKINEIEAALLTGQHEIEQTPESLEKAAKTLLEQGPSLIIITLGPGGSYFQTAAGGGYVPAFQVDTVDAVGCGDAFIAGLLTRLTVDRDWRSRILPDAMKEHLRFANAVGGLTSLNKGVIPALPRLEQVEAFLKEQAN